jgi:plastocyanin
MKASKNVGRLRRTMAILLVGITFGSVVADTGVAWADTYRVRAYRTDSGAWRWRPAHRFIADGDYIRWRNPTSVTHTVRAYDAGTDWNYSVSLAPGTSVRRKFNRRGNFYYRCTIHSKLANGVCSGQCGIIHVS